MSDHNNQVAKRWQNQLRRHIEIFKENPLSNDLKTARIRKAESYRVYQQQALFGAAMLASNGSRGEAAQRLKQIIDNLIQQVRNAGTVAENKLKSQARSSPGEVRDMQFWDRTIRDISELTKDSINETLDGATENAMDAISSLPEDAQDAAADSYLNMFDVVSELASETIGWFNIAASRVPELAKGIYRVLKEFEMAIALWADAATKRVDIVFAAEAF